MNNKYEFDNIEFIDLTEEDLAGLDLPEVGTFKIKVTQKDITMGDAIPPDGGGGGDSPGAETAEAEAEGGAEAGGEGEGDF